MALEGREFIRRFLWHVLPRGFMRVRHFGFLGNRVRRRHLRRIRCLLPPRRQRRASAPSRSVPVQHCPKCHRGVLRYLVEVAPLQVDSS